ncbi:hypothetical protein A2U01_0058157, partial [Trifolium medium]|nr:hypothetical protein [Trifolium medium]
YHISANVKSNMKVKCHFKEDVTEKGKDIMAAWEIILDSETEKEYADNVVIFLG